MRDLYTIGVPGLLRDAEYLDRDDYLDAEREAWIEDNDAYFDRVDSADCQTCAWCGEPDDDGECECRGARNAVETWAREAAE